MPFLHSVVPSSCLQDPEVQVQRGPHGTQEQEAQGKLSAQAWGHGQREPCVTQEEGAQGRHTTYMHLDEVMGREGPVGPKKKEPKARIQRTHMCMELWDGSLEWYPLLPRRDLT